MRTRIFLLFVLFFIPRLLFCQADKITGIWLTENNDSQVEIFKASNGKYYGKIIWLNSEKRNHKDTKNHDEKLRSRPVLGIIVAANLTYNAQTKEWTGASAYDPANGNTYDAYAWFEDNNFDVLHFKGYLLGMRWIGRTTIWKREKEKRQ